MTEVTFYFLELISEQEKYLFRVASSVFGATIGILEVYAKYAIKLLEFKALPKHLIYRLVLEKYFTEKN